jgi:DNA-binding NarL/FixJ family response regulator
MITITIVEDDQELCQSLKVLINGTEGLECVGDYNNSEQAIKNLENDQPDVILMDINLPGMSGIDAVGIIKNKKPDIEIIMLTIHEDNESVFESLKKGASGYLVKNVEPANLLNAIKEVKAGGAPMSMPIARMVLKSFHRNPPLEPLSEREQDVLNKLRKGKSYLTIANELFISKSTVKFHIKNIYRKLHVSNKAEVIIKSYHQDI